MLRMSFFMAFLLKKSICISHLGLLIFTFSVTSINLRKLYMVSNRPLVPGSISSAGFFCPMILFVPPQTHPCLFIIMLRPLWSSFFMLMTLFLPVVSFLSFIISFLFYPTSLILRTWVTHITFLGVQVVRNS